MVTPPPSLGDVLQQAIAASDELNIIRARIEQGRASLGEARASYYPQVTFTERFGRDAAYPSSARTESDPRGQSEFVNANSSKLEVNQMVFDGFKTPAEVERQKLLLRAMEYRYVAASRKVAQDTLDVYLTAWRHLQALQAGVAMVEDLRVIQYKVNLQAAAGATDQTVKSYVDSRLTGAMQELLKTRNAYREALYRLGYLLQQDVQPESFGFTPLLAPVLEDLETYRIALQSTNPDLLEQVANQKAAEQELRKASASLYPTLSLTSDIQDTNDLGGSTGSVRTGNAMVQVSYKLFDGFATRYGKARARGQIAENAYRVHRIIRQLEEDVAQAWRKAVASRQEATLAGEEAASSLKVKQLRAEDVENGQGDIVRLVEAEETLYTAVLRQLDLVQNLTQKRYEIALTSGKLQNYACVDGGCPELVMEPVEYVNPAQNGAPLGADAALSSREVSAEVSATLPANMAPATTNLPLSAPAAQVSATAGPQPDPDTPRDFEAPPASEPASPTP